MLDIISVGNESNPRIKKGLPVDNQLTESAGFRIACADGTSQIRKGLVREKLPHLWWKRKKC